MIKKQSIDDEKMSTTTNIANVYNRLQRLQIKSQKMYENIDQAITKTIKAMDSSEQEVKNEQIDWSHSLLNLHVKMTQIRPLKTVRDEYNDFYKKLSGLGKIIQEMPAQQEVRIKVHNPFSEANIQQIDHSLSDHYLSQQNYEVAETIIPENQKRNFFEQCFILRSDILQGKFDRPVQWIQSRTTLNDNEVGYQIHKMKIISLVKQNKADEAIAYLRKNLSQYATQYGIQIGKLMNFIITQSQKYWGSEENYTNIYKSRYQPFLQVSLPELARKFTKLYLKANKIYLSNPISQCHQAGLKYRLQFLDHLKFMPDTMELPNHLPFSIKTGNKQKYHSYFFCPISKQVFGPNDKNVVLNCGHMVSQQAIEKITEGKESRRKIKCPICQSDQMIQSRMKVEF